MMIDSADLIRKLPMMIQATKTFAKFSEGGDYHIGEPDKWCLNYKEIVKGIEEYCDHKRTGKIKLGAPVQGSFTYEYEYEEGGTVRTYEMGEVVRCKDCKHRDLFSCPLTDNDFQKDEDFCSWGERKGGDDE